MSDQLAGIWKETRGLIVAVSSTKPSFKELPSSRENIQWMWGVTVSVKDWNVKDRVNGRVMQCNYGFRWELSHSEGLCASCNLHHNTTAWCNRKPTISLACTLVVKSFARGICIMINTHYTPWYKSGEEQQLPSVPYHPFVGCKAGFHFRTRAVGSWGGGWTKRFTQNLPTAFLCHEFHSHETKMNDM